MGNLPRCSLCPGVNVCVPPDGPENCDLLFIGEGPGGDENRSKPPRPFVGKTGREVNEHYLPLAGLKRSNVRVDNAISCLPITSKGKLDMNRQKDLDLLQCCAEHHLYPEIERMKPKLIVPMGAFACRAIDPDIDLELQHGKPINTSWGKVYPMYHPAGGVHEPKKMLLIRTDWANLRKYLAGKLYLPVDEYAGSEDYSIIEDKDDLDSYLWGRNDYTMAQDTETKKGGDPFCLTLSIAPGTGRLIRAWDKHLLKRLQWWLDRWRGKILWHNWLFDFKVVAKMDLTYQRKLIVDTMVRSFHLGNVPQGLKALAYRELGMRMQDFDDLVKPHSIPKVLDYYRNANLEEWPKPEEQLVRKDDGGWKMYKPHSMSTKLKVFFTNWAKAEADGRDKNVFDAWDNWEESHQMIEDKLGPWPGKCISHAWEEDQPATIRYACRDADSLLRLYPILNRMRGRVRRSVQENWRDCA